MSDISVCWSAYDQRPSVQDARALDDAESYDGVVTDSHLKGYAEFFIRVLGSIYKNIQVGTPIRYSGQVCCPFFFGDGPGLSDDAIRQYVEKEGTRATHHYMGNMLLVVREDEDIMWTHESGIRDADDALRHLIEQGY